MLSKDYVSDDSFSFKGKDSTTGIVDISFYFKTPEKTMTMEIWYKTGAQAANQAYTFTPFNLPYKGISVSGPARSAPSWSHQPIERPSICIKLGWDRTENTGNYLGNFNKIWDEVIKQETLENPNNVLELKEKIKAFEDQCIKEFQDQLGNQSHWMNRTQYP